MSSQRKGLVHAMILTVSREGDVDEAEAKASRPDKARRRSTRIQKGCPEDSNSRIM